MRWGVLKVTLRVLPTGARKKGGGLGRVWVDRPKPSGGATSACKLGTCVTPGIRLRGPVIS